MRQGHFIISDESISFSNNEGNRNIYYLQKNRNKFLLLLLICCIAITLAVLLLNYETNDKHIDNKNNKNEKIVNYEKEEILNNDLNKIKYKENYLPLINEQCNIISSKKFDCLPKGEVNEEHCINLGCCWLKTDDTNIPKCFYPLHFKRYEYVNVTEHDNGIISYMRLIKSSLYPNDINILRLDVKYISETTINVKVRNYLCSKYNTYCF